MSAEDNDIDLLKTVLNRNGAPQFVVELRPPSERGQDMEAVITSRDPRLSSFTIAMMLSQLLNGFLQASERHRRDLAQQVLHEGTAVLSEGIEEALLDAPGRWGRLEFDKRDDDGG